MLNCRIQKKLHDFRLDLDFSVGTETLVIAGPSGNGKSMTLQAISGLVAPDFGKITIGARTVFDRRRKINLPTEKRNDGFVFQNYAHFPQLTVFENAAFGLAGRKLAKSDRQERVRSMLKKLNIDHLADRLPAELSGGEQQRVALSRALVLEPSVLLLDEPLSALDIATRGRVRQELKRILGELDIPTIFVTHDYEDAISLGDRILVMERGKVIQDGTVTELLNRPRSQFVADFSGSNYFKADVGICRDELTEVYAGNGRKPLFSKERAPEGKTAVMVFPWDVHVKANEPRYESENGWWATVSNVLMYGNRFRIEIEGEMPLTAELAEESFAGWNIREHDKVFVEIPPDKVHLIKVD
ncbi:MAG TPA: ABC transporter ATP-binding protein [Bacillales bacterium]|nr:ABC transporter ATP-binding protein [Bacillales bacterium]